MSFAVSYMGTKRHLVPSLVNVIAQCGDGIFLDLFSGTCVVGRAIAPSRQVWSNDLQLFPQLVANAHFCSLSLPLSQSEAISLVSSLRHAHFTKIMKSVYSESCVEKNAIEQKSASDLSDLFEYSIERAQAAPEGCSSLESYNLFVQRYAGTYFSYEQAAEIDSIRYAIDTLRLLEKISLDQSNSLLLALCVAMSRCSNSTGHFAQAIYPKSSNLRKFSSQRRRSVWHEWQDAVTDIAPKGTQSWRQKNKSFNLNAADLLVDLKRHNKKFVIYADPPYTQDQYSRYYHLYETLILYDYPKCLGRGLYRSDRVVSDFSLATKIEEALSELITLAAQLEGAFILSYPKAGLLRDSDKIIPEEIARHFGSTPRRVEISHSHSTMGGSKGPTKHDVTEIIYQVTT